MSSDIAAAVPLPTVPFDNPLTGQIDFGWYLWAQTITRRTGGGSGVVAMPGGVSGDVQYNAGGAFGGYTNTQLTVKIEPFTSTISGAVPASGGGATVYLNANGGFTTPTLGGTAGGDLSGTYPNPTVANVNAVAYPAAPATGTVPLVTATNVVTYTATTGTGNVARATNPTLAGVTVSGDGLLHLTGQTSDAATAAGTLANAPTAGNPTFWLRISVNGVSLAIPAWPA